MADANLLRVDQQADMEDIQHAYESRRKEWSIKRTLVEQERSLVVKVDENPSPVGTGISADFVG